ALSLHDALPIFPTRARDVPHLPRRQRPEDHRQRCRVRRSAVPARLLEQPRTDFPRTSTEPTQRARPRPMMTTKARVAIIGTGGISQAHYTGYSAAGAEVVALCDVNQEQLTNRAVAWGVKRSYTDFQPMFADGGIDVVSIAAPTAVHHPATLAAAQAGVHVLVEKPMALDLALADEMIAACADAGVVLSVN